jgi:Fe-Mn family superoxide dismutase
MKHALPHLDFEPGALEPFLGAETLAFHHGKHHAGYVAKLNELLPSSGLQELGLTELVQQAEGSLFDLAAQHYNHSFYWRCIAPGGLTGPDGDLLRAIERDFGSEERLSEQFAAAATSLFGSGWCWLVADEGGRLAIRNGPNAGCPLAWGELPVLTCDVWEHAYYIDHRNDRAAYVRAFWDAVNWDFVGLAYSTPAGIEETILGLAGVRSGS